MKILVTGASGFVGGRVMGIATELGHDVFGIGRRVLARSDYASVDLSTVVDGEIPSLPWQPDAVIHAAALASPFAPRHAYERANTEATRNIVAFAERHGRPRLVYVSSSSVLYREGDQYGLTEDSPVGPAFVNDYARTKAAGERITGGYAGSWVVARPRAVFGPGDTVLFPRIIAAARAGRLPLLVGRDTPAMGDVIYVDSLAHYLISLATNDARGTYNLTNGAPVAMHELLLDIIRRLGLPDPTRRVPIGRALRAATAIETGWRVLRLHGEPPITRYGVGVLAWSKTFDPSRMLGDLGEPAVSTDEGIERFVAWQREQL